MRPPRFPSTLSVFPPSVIPSPQLRKAQQQVGEARVREAELRCALAALKGSGTEAHAQEVSSWVGRGGRGSVGGDPRKAAAQRMASGVAERMAILETELAEALEANNRYKEQLKRVLFLDFSLSLDLEVSSFFSLPPASALASAGAADSSAAQQSHEGELAARLADMAAQLEESKRAAQAAEGELARLRAEHEAVAARLAQADVDKKGERRVKGEVERKAEKKDEKKREEKREEKEEKRREERRLGSRPASPRSKVGGVTSSTATPASASAARLGRSSSSRGMGIV
ncbi:unnamed protein product [Closterium sp. NIES-54]